MDILDELKMLADHIDDENNGKPDALSLQLIGAIAEIRKLRAELAKVTWQRNEAQAGLAAMTKSRDAAMRIVTAKDQQMSVLRTQQDQWSEARNTLESERAANARITADLATSQAECERLRADAERYRWLRNINSPAYVVWSDGSADDGLIGDLLDAAIDAAIAGKGGEE